MDDYDGRNQMEERPRPRYRRDETADPTNPNPSIVVHVRNLNPKATEADLLEALSHFGPIAYATCMPVKRMALVEFEEIEDARKCVVFAQTSPISVAGFPALFNYSTSQAIQRIGLESETPNHVLVLTVYNAHYPLTVDVIHQICQPHGQVVRIAMIKRTMVQALVEFESVEAAKKAKHAMNGADIYSGCCTLKVEFAKPDRVKVVRNDQEQWDYTVAADQQQPPSQRRALLTDEHKPGPTHQPRLSGNGAPSSSYHQLPAYDDYTRPAYTSGYSQQPPPDPHYPQKERADYGGLSFSRNANYNDRRSSYASRSQDGYNDSYDSTDRGNSHESCVLMLYGVNHHQFNCDKIFNLLCSYGNCIKVKFMQSKEDTCMAEMHNTRGVGNALRYLQNAKVYETALTLRPSKQNTLRDTHEPFDMPDGSPSFADYTRSRNHRFSNPDLASRNRLAYPSNQLHWFNTPVTMTEERLKKIFEEKGVKPPQSVVIFNTKSERSASGLVEFESTEEATVALMLCNHTPIVEASGRPPYILKLAFGGGR